MAGGLTTAQSGLISSGVNASANAIGSLITLNQYKKNREFNAREAAKARQFQLNMWNKQNAYDSPAAKMQRYIDAGLNPNLVYGDIGSLGNPVPSAAQASGGSSGAVPSFSPNLDLVNAKLAEAQINRLNTQNENDSALTEAQCIELFERAGLDKASAAKAYAELPLLEAKTQEAKQALENMKQQWDILDEKKKQEAFQTAFIEATQSMRIQGANAEQEAIAKTAVALAFAQLANVKSDTALNWANVALAKQKSLESQSLIRLNNAQMAVAANQARLIAAQINTEGAKQRQIMSTVVQTESYNRNIYRQEGDNFIERGFKWLVTEPLDALSRMLGNIINVGL